MFVTLGWMPDDAGIYYVEADRMKLVSLDGGRPRVFPIRVDGYGTPAWSPDGSLIAGIKGVTEMFVVRAAGEGLKPLATNPRIAPFPEWSPNGDRIAFMAGGYTSQNVHTMRPDGSDEVAVSQMGQADLPRWVR